MRLSSLGLLIVFLAGTALRAEDAVPRKAEADSTPTFVRDVLPFLKAHCFHCHGTEDGKDKADLTLSKYTDDLSVQQDRKVWDNVLHMLRAGEMPPMERKRPPAADMEAVIASIEGVLANLDCSKAPNVGRVTLRRLNRAEYNNTIRDLVGVDLQPAADFPNDDVGYGFDNIGDVLSMTPLLFERYLAAAETILQKVDRRSRDRRAERHPPARPARQPRRGRRDQRRRRALWRRRSGQRNVPRRRRLQHSRRGLCQTGRRRARCGPPFASAAK